MKGMILLASVLCGMGFITLCGYLLLQRSPELVGKMMSKLQASGRRSLNLSEFQAQHAVAFASGHAFLVALCGAVGWLISGNLIGGVVAAVVLYLLPARWFAWQRKKRRQQIESELPDALLFIASALRAGSALSVAIQVLVRDQVGPLGQEFGLVLKEQRLGVSFDDAWERRVPVVLPGGTVDVLSKIDFVTNKKAVGRAKDLADLALLDEADGAQ